MNYVNSIDYFGLVVWNHVAVHEAYHCAYNENFI